MDKYRPHSSRLENKTALITGSTHGIGLGIAKRFAHEGSSVVVNDDGQYNGDDIVEMMREIGSDAIYVKADVSQPEELRYLVDRTVEEFGDIDFLVNNAAGWDHRTFQETTLESWEFVISTSLRAPWLAAKYAVDNILPGGSVINISSIHARYTTPGSFPYNVAKAGLNGLTRALAIELGPLDIRSNAIMPGAIGTDPDNIGDEDLTRDRPLEPTGRRGRPADIASLAAFLVSDEAEFINGVTIPVDGGRTTLLNERSYDSWYSSQK